MLTTNLETHTRCRIVFTTASFCFHTLSQSIEFFLSLSSHLNYGSVCKKLNIVFLCKTLEDVLHSTSRTTYARMFTFQQSHLNHPLCADTRGRWQDAIASS